MSKFDGNRPVTRRTAVQLGAAVLFAGLASTLPATGSSVCQSGSDDLLEASCSVPTERSRAPQPFLGGAR
jgi:hypothetical protein